MDEKEFGGEFEEPPGTEEPPAGDMSPSPWEGVPRAKWNDWRWQLSNRLNTAEEFQRVVALSADEIEGLSAPGRFRVDVTPYFASLMDPEDPNCPIRRQVIPTCHEIMSFEAEMVDSLAEDSHSPVPGLVHRYPDRVLMLVTTQCASYCRFCTRSRIVGDPHAQFSSSDHDQGIAYIESHPEVRDVLLSGGDPLTLPQGVLEGLLRRLRSIPHVEVIRIGTRVPVFLPQRIDEALVSMLQKYHPVWMNIHFNHPKEITPEVEAALALLANAGIPLGSQTVLMAGINDCPNIILALVHKLVKNRVRPYYLYQCDLVHGAGHFRTPVAKGIEIMEALRGHTSGYAIPAFVIDAPEGGGKVPLLPNYLMSMSENKVVVRNYEGFISTYVQPTDYQSHEAATCSYCQAQLSEGGQEGVAGLLAGRELSIAPEGWHRVHQRGEASQALPEEWFKKAVAGNGRKPRPTGNRASLQSAVSRKGSNGRQPAPQGIELEVEGKRLTAWRVGLICNMKKNVQADSDAPPDALAEYDSVETVQALQDALRSEGHEVILLEANETLLDTVRQLAPDICFNIAEGLRGDARESQVPALLEMLGIPYTASKVLGHAISLDKAATKRMWRYSGLPTAPFQVLYHGDEPLDPSLSFPLFVKPVHEGTGMGINSDSVVRDQAELRRQARWVIETYRQPALVENYLPGREFTVGVIGNRLLLGEAPRDSFYDHQGYHVFPVLEIDSHHGVGEGLYNAEAKSYVPGEQGAPLYLCPADIPAPLEAELKKLAVAAYEAIGALDVSRIDFRLGPEGKPYLMEINTLPGLNPIVSDICIMAQAEGMEYPRLINEILYLAADRYAREGIDLGAHSQVPRTRVPAVSPLPARAVV